MRIRRRSLRKGLVAVGCLVGTVDLPAAAIGGALLGLGAGLHFWSKGCLEQNRRLTTAGPYRFTRNPFYLANLLIDAGLCCVIGRPLVGAVFLVLWAVSYRETIAREEARLAGLFGEEYARYRSHVPRLFPNGRVWPAEWVTGRFRLDNDGLARGAEYARLLGIAIAPWAIVAAEIVRRDGLALLDGAHAGKLALVLGLPAMWVVKLALAETFRRPETALVPWIESTPWRLALTSGLAVVTLLLIERITWLAVVPGLWLALVLLDLLGDRRRASKAAADGAAAAGEARPGWRYSPFVAAGSLVAAAGVAVLDRSI